MAVGRDARATFTAIVKGDASQAVTEFKKLGGTVEKATAQSNGAVSKWRTLTTSAMNEVRQHANLLAGAALAGIVTFAARGAKEFMDLAKAAIDLGKATGLSTEEASRWIAVADDQQVAADALATTVGRIPKTLDSAKWAKYGIATREAGGMARSTNAILVDTLAYLSSLPNATERATAGADLFGKSFAAIAPMLGHTKAQYEDMLASVGSGEVITDSEAQKAERMRLQFDAMADAVRSFAMALGSALSPMVALLGPATTLLTKMGEVFSPDTSKDVQHFMAVFKDSEGDVVDMSRAIDDLLHKKWNARPIDIMDISGSSNRFKVLKDTFREVATGSAAAGKAMYDNLALTVQGAERGSTALQAMADKYGLNRDTLAELNSVLFDTTGGMDSAALAASDLAGEMWDIYDATLANINAQLGVEGATQNYLSAMDRLNSTVDDSKTLVDEHAVALTGVKSAALAVAAAAAEQGKAQADANGMAWTAEDATRAQIDALAGMAAWLAPGSELRTAIEGYADDLRTKIPTSVTTKVQTEYVTVRDNAGRVVQVPQYIANPKNTIPAKATGGAASGMTLVGERGPELLNLPAGTWAHNAGETSRMLQRANSGSVNVATTSNVFNLSVAAGPGTNRAQIGRELLDLIRAAYAAGAPKLAAA